MTADPRKRADNSRELRRVGCLVCVASALLVGCAEQPSPARGPAAGQPSEVLYDGKLGAGWLDWGWGAHDLGHGAAQIKLSEYGGWVIKHEPIPARFGALSFRMLAPASFGDFLQVQVANGENDNSRPTVDIGPEHESSLPGSWIAVSVPWSELNPSGAPFDRVKLHAHKPVATDWVQFDEVRLTPASNEPASALAFTPSAPPVAPTAAATSAGPGNAVHLSADCRAPGHPISPYIYGVAGDVPDLFATARRWGGNPTSRYNWQLGTVFNAGKDWYFENQKTEDYRAFLAGNLARRLVSALTIPTIGWVAKDSSAFGFPVSVYGAQKTHDPYREDAGDGVDPNGKEIRPKGPTQTSVEATPDMMQKWVEAIREQDKKGGTRSVGLYFLDNEPSLWSSTHRDVHPDPLSYDELLDRTIRYGSAIRAADPQAVIAGPAEWGWLGYQYSGRDVAAGVSAKPDRLAHGDVPLIPWYLKKLSEHDRSTGKRVLDVLDVHYYPQEQGVYGDAADPATAALRLRSTRSLWDPTYKDESWINDTIRLLPRLKEWVQQNYPGLGISIGEYNFGGEQHISGALALAEVLGRFGVGGADYAFYWRAPPKDSPAYWAFRAYRNFDGKNGRFLDRSVDTQMAPGVSLFASRDESGKHLVLIALNLDPTNAANATIELTGCGAVASHKDYSYATGARSLALKPASAGEGAVGALQESLPPYSINVFDVVLK